MNDNNLIMLFIKITFDQEDNSILSRNHADNYVIIDEGKI